MKRNKYSLSYPHKFSMRMGDLVPIGFTHVLPGDTIQHTTSALLRCSPLLAPVMHPIRVKTHHFFVPHRLIWDDWESFITGGTDGEDNSVIPWRDFDGPEDCAPGSLLDYCGVRTGQQNLKFNMLRIRAYNLIYNEFYRDEQLETPAPLSKASGEDTITYDTLQQAAWDKDYFTTARPEAQLGPDVIIPLVGATNLGVPVRNDSASTTAGQIRVASSNALLTATTLNSNASGFMTSGGGSTLRYDPNGTLFADTDDLGISALDLREYMATLRFEEARNLFGSRYTEYLRYLGVRSSDARLQRPEYLGGGMDTIQFSEVLQTTPGSTSDDTVGAMQGHGIASHRSNRYRRFFEEHGFVVTMMTVMPVPLYMQGLPRDMLYETKEDFWQKELQFIGQQEVKKGEIYSEDKVTDQQGWGFQDRYQEFRQGFGKVSGQFRTTLDFWHAARIFDSAPVLNGGFIRGTPTDRIFVDQTDGAEQIWVMAHHSIQARRLVAKGGKVGRII